MDFWSSYTERQNGINLKNLFDFSSLTDAKRNHLSKVYGLLGLGVLGAALGVYMQLYFLALPHFLLFLIKIGCLFGMILTRQKAMMEQKVMTPTRMGCFGGFCLSLGMNMAEYLHFVHYGIDTAIVPTAFLGSLAIFTCFSLGAMLAKSRSYLFLGSILGSAMSYLMLLSLANLFFRSVWLNDIKLYLGLFIYVGFVVYDTQVTLYDFERGNRDYLIHALELFMDFAGIFIRLVHILSQNEENRREKRRGEERSR